MKKITLLIIITTGVWAARPYHDMPHPDHNHKVSSMADVEHVIWDGNQISTTHGNHGDIASYHLSGESGLQWPKGSGKTAVFQSGLWMASGRSKVAGSDTWSEEIRSAAAEYTVEFVPGNMAGTEEGHIYQIHRSELDAFLENDYATYSSMSLEIPITTLEGASAFTVMTEVTLPTDDFKNYPAHAGAPWVDANDDGVYNIEDGDHPEILGDMFHWYVMNDGDASQHTPLWGTAPMNVEIQTSVFGFDQAGPLGNILFIRWVCINRGPDDLDSVFVSMWHDDDVGDHTDDLVACDTDLSLGYTYNDIDGDNMYGIEAPAAGGDFFQGPMVASPGDTAQLLTWDQGKGYYLRKYPDQRQLGLTSFVKYINGDPDLGDPETAQEAYNFMNGTVGNTGEPFVDPTTGEPTMFIHDADPVTGTGWLDTDPDDRRYLMTSGPFTFLVGDTVETVGSMIIAAGSNWAKSITKMKYYDKFAQAAFDANFDVCSPPSPTVEVAQLENKVILSWEDGSDKVEDYACTEYSFQGYNVYQGESVAGPWHRIATYDIVDGQKILLDNQLDEVTGELLEVPSQFGSDSGINHYIEVTDDVINSVALINHRQYYFAVTAYAYAPEAAQRVIESPQAAIVVVPGGPGVGSALSNVYSDTLEITHTGLSDGKFYPHVVDPYMLTNEDYSISFSEIDSVTHWVLTNTTDNVVVASDALFPATPDYYDYENSDLEFSEQPLYYENVEIMDGFILGSRAATYSAPSGYKNSETLVDADTSTSLVFAGLDANGGTWNGFITALEANGITQLAGVAGAEELQLDLKVVFTDEGSVATFFQSGLLVSGSADTVWVPFELYTVEDDRRVDIAIYLAAGNKPLFEADEDNEGSTKFDKNLFIIPVYRDYTGVGMSDHFTDGALMGWMCKFDKNATSFESGNEFLIEFNNPIIPGTDVYTFTASGLQTVDGALDKVNVFPNPYFGRNPEESNPQDRKVFFTNLGIGSTTIRIFTIAGDLVAKVEKMITEENTANDRAEWDLRNQNGIPVASGMYIAYIEVEDQNGKVHEKILKLAVFQPEERLSVF